ncbi:unnamed protein product [Ilex paraguariensis]|uniref:Uncharacterized protein n=1 Tax=Ilex paraguariensis TaxID=185542 RepID=A0ABC8UFW6_9AQUA
MGGLGQDLKVAPTENSQGMVDGEQLIHQPENHEDDGANSRKEISMNVDEVHRITILNLREGNDQSSSETQSVNEIEGSTPAKVISHRRGQEGEMSEFLSGDSCSCRPILPWLNGDGTINKIVYNGLIRRVLGVVMQNPGILEDNIISQMCVLNPQSCRKLLELMILDNLIRVRKMHQATSSEPPAILGRLFGSSFKKSKLTCQKHFFANPMSTAFL